jgi:hypothetical protein
MASNFQSSFIPKDPMIESQVFKKKKTGFVGILAISLFITSIIISGGVYFYKIMLKSEIQSLESQLSDAEKNIDKKTISEMTLFAQKLQITKSILVKHQVVSNFLKELSSSTISSVQFTDFNYGEIKNNVLMVSLKGKAANYASVALQENVLSQNKYFKSVEVSGLSLNDKGFVAFDFNIAVDPQISLYLSPNATTTAKVSTTTASTTATTTKSTVATTTKNTLNATTTKTVATTTPIKN